MRPFRLYGLIVLSAAAGALFVGLARQGALPFWLAAGLATCSVYLLYWRMALPRPPAIALGCAAFFMGGSLLFRNVA